MTKERRCCPLSRDAGEIVRWEEEEVSRGDCPAQVSVSPTALSGGNRHTSAPLASEIAELG